jgi:hypothetical protein
VCGERGSGGGRLCKYRTKKPQRKNEGRTHARDAFGKKTIVVKSSVRSVPFFRFVSFRFVLLRLVCAHWLGRFKNTERGRTPFPPPPFTIPPLPPSALHPPTPSTPQSIPSSHSPLHTSPPSLPPSLYMSPSGCAVAETSFKSFVASSADSVRCTTLPLASLHTCAPGRGGVGVI